MRKIYYVEGVEMNEAWYDVYSEGYMHQFQPGSIHKSEVRKEGLS